MNAAIIQAISVILAARIAEDRGVRVADLGLLAQGDAAEPDPWSVITWGDDDHRLSILIGDASAETYREGTVLAHLTAASDWDGTLVLPATEGHPSTSYPLRPIRDAAERLVRAQAKLRVAAPQGQALIDLVCLHATSRRIVLLEAIRRWLALRTDAVAWSADGAGLICEKRSITLDVSGNVIVDGSSHTLASPITITSGLILRADLALQAEWLWLGIPSKHFALVLVENLRRAAREARERRQP